MLFSLTTIALAAAAASTAVGHVIPLEARAGHNGLVRRISPQSNATTDEHSLGKRDFNGRMTYYDTSVGLGSCGNFNPNSAYTVAMNANQMQSSYCGKSIWISYGGKTVGATVQDTCPGCPWGGLDLSEGLFAGLADMGLGVIQASWGFSDGSSNPEPSTSSTWQAPSSTYTPPTSTYVAPTTSWTPTSTYTPPSSTWTPEASTSSSSQWVAPSSSSTSSSAASSTSASSSSAASSSVTSLTVSAPFVVASKTASATGAAASNGASNGDGSETVESSSNLAALSSLLVNYGSVIVAGAGGVVS